MQKTVERMPGVELIIEVLNHPAECAGVAGMEVEKLPAVFINDEQITAGGLLHRRQLIKLIESRMD